jgi:hypothetical protein
MPLAVKAIVTFCQFNPCTFKVELTLTEVYDMANKKQNENDAIERITADNQAKNNDSVRTSILNEVRLLKADYPIFKEEVTITPIRHLRKRGEE